MHPLRLDITEADDVASAAEHACDVDLPINTDVGSASSPATVLTQQLPR